VFAAPCVKFAIWCALYAPAVPAGLNLNVKGFADNSISRVRNVPRIIAAAKRAFMRGSS
jgi:hypothetical protein